MSVQCLIMLTIIFYHSNLRVVGITSTRLQCLKSYLSTRLEFVHENVESYSHSKGNDRVPHGSVVGRILFIFHVSLRHIIHYQCYEDYN